MRTCVAYDAQKKRGKRSLRAGFSQERKKKAAGRGSERALGRRVAVGRCGRPALRGGDRLGSCDLRSLKIWQV